LTLKLDFSNINQVAEVYERTTRMDIHKRHPYVGELVFTAFSGSHQDAINKGLAKRKTAEQGAAPVTWAVPYLPIDPHDIGRTYESIIRINSQSGKGGVAYVMEHDFGCRLPKTMHPEFARVVQVIAEKQGGEVMPSEINTAFENEYLKRKSPLELAGISAIEEKPDSGEVNLKLKIHSDRPGFLKCRQCGVRPAGAMARSMLPVTRFARPQVARRLFRLKTIANIRWAKDLMRGQLRTYRLKEMTRRHSTVSESARTFRVHRSKLCFQRLTGHLPDLRPDAAMR
jgi:hypothetical protein